MMCFRSDSRYSLRSGTNPALRKCGQEDKGGRLVLRLRLACISKPRFTLTKFSKESVRLGKVN